MTPIIALIAVQQSADKAELAWKPVAGAALAYADRSVVEEPGGPIQIDAVIRTQVVAVGTNGETTLKSWLEEAILRVAGNEIRDDRRSERQFRVGARGQLLAMIEKPDAQALRLGVLTRFVAPEKAVGRGDGWEWAPREDKKSGLPGYRTRYKVETLDASQAKVSFTFEETTGDTRQKASGNWTVRRDGVPVALECTVQNFLGDAGTTAKLSRTLRP